MVIRCFSLHRIFVAVLLGLLYLQIGVCHSAHAQGQWVTSLTPCDQNGDPLGSGYDGRMTDGILTGSGNATQSSPVSDTGFPLSYPSAYPTYQYSWLDEATPNVTASATSSLVGWYHDPDSDTPFYVTSQGTATVHFSLFARYLWKTWWSGSGPTPATGMPTPPAVEPFLLRTELQAFASDYYGANGYKAVTASDYSGLSATSAVRDDVFGETASISAPVLPSPLYGQGFSQLGGGNHLVHAGLQLVNGKAIYTVTLSGDGSVWAAASIGSLGVNGGSGAVAYLNGYVCPDNRAVTLRRSEARQVAKFTGQNGQVYGEWVDPDGTGHGDTTYSYWTFSNAGKSVVVADHFNWQAFTPAYSGPWPLWSATWNYSGDIGGNWYQYLGDPYDPLYVSDQHTNNADIAMARTQSAPAVMWSWSPTESEDWEMFGKWSAPDGNGEGWSPNGVGDPGLTKAHPAVTKPINYSVTETVSQHFPWQLNTSILDGASTSCQYFLTFHDSIDNWQWANPGSPAIEEQPELYPASAQVAVDPYHPVPVSVPVNNSAIEADIANYQGASLTMNTSAALVGAWPDVIGLTSPEGAAAAILLTVAGYTLSSASPPPPSPDTASATFDAFQRSVTEQQGIEAHTTGNLGDNNQIMRPDINRLPYGLVKTITPDNINQWFNGDFGAVTFQAVEGKHRFDRLWVGDGWDTAGYTGKVNAHVHYPGTPFQIYEWTFGTPQPSH